MNPERVVRERVRAFTDLPNVGLNRPGFSGGSKP